MPRGVIFSVTRSSLTFFFFLPKLITRKMFTAAIKIMPINSDFLSQLANSIKLRISEWKIKLKKLWSLVCCFCCSSFVKISRFYLHSGFFSKNLWLTKTKRAPERKRAAIAFFSSLERANFMSTPSLLNGSFGREGRKKIERAWNTCGAQ